MQRLVKTLNGRVAHPAQLVPLGITNDITEGLNSKIQWITHPRAASGDGWLSPRHRFIAASPISYPQGAYFISEHRA